MNENLLKQTITNFENYLIDTDCLLDVLTDICDNAAVGDKTLAKVIWLCDMFKEKNQKTWDLIRYR